MRRWIFILISILTLSACHSGGQKDDALSDVDIKVIRYDRLQYEAFALNSFSALQKMSTECPQATKLLIERVLDIGRAKDNPEQHCRGCSRCSGNTGTRTLCP